MTKPLTGKNTLLLVANGFDEFQMTQTQRALQASGTKTSLASTEQGLVNSWDGKGWGHHFAVEAHVSQTLAADFDLLVIPGGARSITRLTSSPHTRRILTGFIDARKPIVLLNESAGLLSWAERSQEDHVLLLHVEPDDGFTSALLAHLSGQPADNIQQAAA